MFFKEITSDTFLLLVFILYAVCFIIQMFYYWGIFSRLAFYKNKTKQNQYKPISVVICAKNEYTNLKKNLTLFLEQDYPDYEVVVVNDCSDDDSDYLLRSFSDKYKHLNVVNILKNVNFFSGKKFALAVGIKSAKHDLLLLTDADCQPKSNKWIMEMQNNFIGNTEIVLGYSGHEKKKGFLNKLIRYDTIMTAMQYLSWSLAGVTYMGVGRNLAYNRQLFYKNKGFTSHYQIPSGDDDLFINQVAKRGNTRIEISAQSQTYSAPKKTFYDWYGQKKRHYSTGFLYKTSHKLMLGIFLLSQFLFYSSLAVLLVMLIINSSYYNISIVCSLFVLRMATQMLIFKKTMNKLDEKNLLLISPVLDILFILLASFMAMSNVIVKENKWK
ncbi:MAG: glycosyltransferase [Bacteroidales bacterium]|jgi:glycosyltransferase involved in cell wall biosynthesis